MTFQSLEDPFTPGERATFSPRGSTAPRVLDMAGPVVIVRALTSDEADLDETGPMYAVRGVNGKSCDAFVDELTRP